MQSSELPKDAVELAKALLGLVFLRQTFQGAVGGRIVETEAYHSTDPASHTFRGKTDRCRSMFSGLGHLYVYQIYGTSFCVNIVAGIPGSGSGVLLRALEPTIGVELMAQRRRTTIVRDLARGPGRLTEALAIGPGLDGHDVFSSSYVALYKGETPQMISVGRRIGISRAIDEPLRFFLAHNPYVSGTKAHNQARR